MGFRILQFLSTSDIGGTEKMVLSLIKGMDKEIFQNEVCILSSKGLLGDEFEKETNVYYLNYGKVSIFKVIKELFFLLKRNKYDIIHIYGLRANTIGRIIGRITGCRRIISGLRSTLLSDKIGKFYEIIGILIDKITLPFIKLYISNSQAAIDFLVKNGYPPSKFRLIPNGIDSIDLTPDSHLKELCSGKVVLICVGSFKPVKGHKLLIEALKIVKEKHLPFKLLLVGNGPLKEEIFNYVLKANLGEDIIFLGKKENVGKYLSISDIFILPSIMEGMPVAIMEACLASLPVIAFNIGGIPELVVNNETGILVPPFDIKVLAEAIEELLVDSKKRKKLGKQGYKRIKDEFSLSKMIKDLSSIYISLMNH